MADHDSASTVAIKPVNSILNGRGSPVPKLPLPPEVMELIFWDMEECTFFIAICTCRQFLQAGTSRRNLLRHIRRLPGLRPGLEDLYDSRLQGESCSRATASGCMAGILADIRQIALPHGTMTPSSIFSTRVRKGGTRDQRLALANENGTISIYDLQARDGDCKLILTLDLNDLDDRRSPVNICRLAFSPKGDLAVLYWQEGQNICDHEGDYQFHSQEYEPGRDCRKRKIFELTTFYRCFDETRDPVDCQLTCRRSRVLATAGRKPIGLALGSSGNMSVAWIDEGILGSTMNRDPNDITKILMTRSCLIELVRTSRNSASDTLSLCKDDTGRHLSQNTNKKILAFPDVVEANGEAVRMEFADKDKKLLVHQARAPVHTHSVRDHTFDDSSAVSTSTRTRVSPKDLDRRRDYHFHVGNPFHGSHSKVQGPSVEPHCLRSYLALGIGFDSSIDLHTWEGHLYILQTAEHLSRPRCESDGHIVILDENLTHLQNQWNIVALLAGWRQTNSTLGSVLAISPGGNRIASAVWDRVLVWTIHPHLLHQGGLEHYFPPRDYNVRKGFGRIRPVLLPPQGVVHSLKWIDNALIFALTDKGLVRWNIGPTCSAKREIDSTSIRCKSGRHIDPSKGVWKTRIGSSSATGGRP